MTKIIAHLKAENGLILIDYFIKKFPYQVCCDYLQDKSEAINECNNNILDKYYERTIQK